jgi:hypothetical protein
MEEFKHDPKCFKVVTCNCDNLGWEHDEFECDYLHCSFCHTFEWIEKGLKCTDCDLYFCMDCWQNKTLECSGHYFDEEDIELHCKDVEINDKVKFYNLENYKCDCVHDAKNKYKNLKWCQILHCSILDCHNYSRAGDRYFSICEKCGKNFCKDCVYYGKTKYWKEMEFSMGKDIVLFDHTFNSEDKPICTKKKK